MGVLVARLTFSENKLKQVLVTKFSLVPKEQQGDNSITGEWISQLSSATNAFGLHGLRVWRLGVLQAVRAPAGLDW